MVKRTARVRTVMMMVGSTLLLAEGGLCAHTSTRSPRPPRREVEGDPEILFRVHDYAHMPASTLNRAENQTARVLRQTGIRCQWEVFPGQKPQTCNGRGTNPRIPVIDLNILSNQMASRSNRPGGTLGYSPLTSSGAPPSIASVFYNRALELAEQGPASLDQLLGYAIAHEVGHVLRPSAPHSLSGVMEREWGLGELERISKGSLYFSAEESAEMRTEVVARGTKAAATEENPCRQAPEETNGYIESDD